MPQLPQSTIRWLRVINLRRGGILILADDVIGERGKAAYLSLLLKKNLNPIIVGGETIVTNSFFKISPINISFK